MGITSDMLVFPDAPNSEEAKKEKDKELGEGTPTPVPGMSITIEVLGGNANQNTSAIVYTLATQMSNPTSPLAAGQIMSQLDKSAGMTIGSVAASEDCPTITEKWNYKDAPEALGPADWGNTYPKCKQGNQSPIRLPVTAPKSAETVFRRLDFDYKFEKATLMNDGRTLMAMMAPGSTFKVSGEANSEATLQYAQLHSPSEHVFTDDEGNDIRYAAELQLHHRTATGLIKVVSILYRVNSPSPFIDDLFGWPP